MPKQTKYKIDNVKPVTFKRFIISDDGEKIIFEVHDKADKVGHIAVDWLDLGFTDQLIGRAAEAGAKARRALGKSDIFDGSSDLTAQLVSMFQVSEFPDQKLKILSLQSPIGFRCDFAIPTDAVDQRGRLYPRAIAEELLADMNEIQQKPH